MASSTELTFMAAVVAAEGVRQGSKAAAFTTYGFDPANYTTYKTALSDADVAYFNSVKTALDASNLTLGNLGMSGPIPTTWAPLNGMA